MTWICRVHGVVRGKEIQTMVCSDGQGEYITTGHTCGAIARRAPFETEAAL